MNPKVFLYAFTFATGTSALNLFKNSTISHGLMNIISTGGNGGTGEEAFKLTLIAPTITKMTAKAVRIEGAGRMRPEGIDGGACDGNSGSTCEVIGGASGESSVKAVKEVKEEKFTPATDQPSVTDQHIEHPVTPVSAAATVDHPSTPVDPVDHSAIPVPAPKEVSADQHATTATDAKDKDKQVPPTEPGAVGHEVTPVVTPSDSAAASKLHDEPGHVESQPGSHAIGAPVTSSAPVTVSTTDHPPGITEEEHASKEKPIESAPIESTASTTVKEEDKKSSLKAGVNAVIAAEKLKGKSKAEVQGAGSTPIEPIATPVEPAVAVATAAHDEDKEKKPIEQVPTASTTPIEPTTAGTTEAVQEKKSLKAGVNAVMAANKLKGAAGEQGAANTPGESIAEASNGLDSSATSKSSKVPSATELEEAKKKLKKTTSETAEKPIESSNTPVPEKPVESSTAPATEKSVDANAVNFKPSDHELEEAKKKLKKTTSETEVKPVEATTAPSTEKPVETPESTATTTTESNQTKRLKDAAKGVITAQKVFNAMKPKADEKPVEEHKEREDVHNDIPVPTSTASETAPAPSTEADLKDQHAKAMADSLNAIKARAGGGTDANAVPSTGPSESPSEDAKQKHSQLMTELLKKAEDKHLSGTADSTASTAAQETAPVHPVADVKPPVEPAVTVTHESGTPTTAAIVPAGHDAHESVPTAQETAHTATVSHDSVPVPSTDTAATVPTATSGDANPLSAKQVVKDQPTSAEAATPTPLVIPPVAPAPPVAPTEASTSEPLSERLIKAGFNPESYKSIPTGTNERKAYWDGLIKNGVITEAERSVIRDQLKQGAGNLIDNLKKEEAGKVKVVETTLLTHPEVKSTVGEESQRNIV